MSDAETEEARCNGKKRYVSPTRSAQVAKDWRRNGRQVAHYRCTVCGGWHIGYSQKKRRIGVAR